MLLDSEQDNDAEDGESAEESSHHSDCDDGADGDLEDLGESVHVSPRVGWYEGSTLVRVFLANKTLITDD